MDYNKLIGANLKKHRKEKSKTQLQVSKDLGINPKSLSQWENGFVKPDWKAAKKLCDYYNIKLDDLLKL